MADRHAEARSRKDLDDYPAVMTLSDYCEYYAVSKATARRWVAEGRAIRVPGHRHIRILRESIRTYEQHLLEESLEQPRQSAGARARP